MNLRKDNNGKALKAWKRQGVGHIAKPLRYIGEKTNGRTAKGEIVYSAQYIAALKASRQGDGDFVQRMALSLP